jgi:hypothetical protein
VITPAAHGIAPDAQSIVLATAYAVVYGIVLLAAATLVFSGRNFK